MAGYELAVYGLVFQVDELVDVGGHIGDAFHFYVDVLDQRAEFCHGAEPECDGVLFVVVGFVLAEEDSADVGVGEELGIRS